MLFIDQLGHSVFLEKVPRRIISLVPSQTELLVDLGLEENIVGVTKFCIHPSHIKKEKTIVGGTKTYHFDIIQKLQPDLIIGNKEENDREGIERLQENYPVWMSDISTIDESIQMIGMLGDLLGVEQKAFEIAERVKKDLGEYLPNKGTAVYLIWNDPVMVAGKDTFIDEMMAVSGFENLMKDSRYPVLTLQELKDLAPEFLLLSSEPFPFKERHLSFFQQELPDSRIMLVDGELFSWYGTRLLESRKYFESLV